MEAAITVVLFAPVTIPKGPYMGCLARDMETDLLLKQSRTVVYILIAHLSDQYLIYGLHNVKKSSQATSDCHI